MAVLENIRKRSLILILVIGLALFSFVISDLFRNGGGIGSNTSSVGEVNGETLPRAEFADEVEYFSRQYGERASTVQVVNQVWERQLRSKLLDQQCEELGINIEKDQIINVVKSNPAFAQDTTFQNEAGVFDDQKFIEFIADLRLNNPAAYEQWKLQEDALIKSAMEQTYLNLIKAGVGATQKEGELAYKLENDKVDIKYVKVPYSTVADSLVTVSTSEVQKYIDGHKEEYKDEASRDIQYVYFAEKPSEEDETEIREGVAGLLDNRVEYNNTTEKNDTVPGFRTTTDVEGFVNANSDIKFDSTYVAKASLPASVADTLFNLGAGEVYGPYKDNGYYKLSRMLNRKANGSAKASHILIQYVGSARANPDVTRSKEEAGAKAKEVLAEVQKSDADFAALARENSDGPTGPRGGDLGYFTAGQMAKPFNDFVFANPTGKIGMVETDFGFHVIKVEDKRDVVQIATIAREIEPSEKTMNDLFTEATKFEMEATDGNFTEVAKEKSLQIRPVKNLKAMDEQLIGIGNQRSVVQWAFKDETEDGDIKRFDVASGYIIAQLTNKRKKGVAKAKDVSAVVTPIIRKQKKARWIEENSNTSSLEEFAKSNKVNVASATGVNMKSPSISGAGREPKVVGAAFALEEGVTSGVIEGRDGAYMVRVTKKTNASPLDNYGTYANTLKSTNRSSADVRVFNALKESADIEDNRAMFY
ncbi:peptidylprolyl isomerase [Sinomicrobium weinanense]|uniref:Periplasmic chaperone PpiD n=1 Tax=Sinomicrobium weinanense TaxID=2842200 RepID=A0A926JU80_9FLAO|nr:peptidylprolyl isomerase [Sinomicrobium weinanense]MBC9797570.1 peptidylprolyl isomerase [Sinomicrobium weinanense]MBU3123637.1 peptidylprolyl isomerase [Sinomicrobium weinanense]